jgi:hypothetical protein
MLVLLAILTAKDRCCIDSRLRAEECNAGSAGCATLSCNPAASYLLLQLPRGNMLLLLHHHADLFC